MSTAELAVSYAALILADDGIEITVRALDSCVLFQVYGGCHPSRVMEVFLAENSDCELEELDR